MTDQQLEQLIAAWLEGRITQAESDRLQQRLLESAEARKTFCNYASLDATLHSIAAGDVEFDSQTARSLPRRPKFTGRPDTSPWKLGAAMFWAQLALAAGALILVGTLAYQLGRGEAGTGPVANVNPPVQNRLVDRTSSGHATLRQAADIRWPVESGLFREGDVLPAGVFEFDQGVAEIDFFCGATVVVEGPARLDVESDWSVRLLDGRLRATVPPAARGFVVKAADSEIVDLGTEFAVEVDSDNVNLAVVDGEVKLSGGQFDGDHLTTGQAQSLLGGEVSPDSLDRLKTIADVQSQRQADVRQRFEQWQAWSRQLASDPRLEAYYPLVGGLTENRRVENAAASGNVRDGKAVGLVSLDSGRLGSEDSALGFERLGSRVRVRLDGTFQAFTFVCWVKINSLDHLYNALFMADGYENGEPHWQFHNDGRLMLSVMVDDTPGSGRGQLPDARLHRIYFSPHIWDESMRGRWIHLASVYDPTSRTVAHYVDGQQVSRAKIIDEFYIRELRIGAGEIGNWGQPFRNSPEFSVRNLNGSIDEMAIFGAALDGDEIRDMFENSKPVGF